MDEDLIWRLRERENELADIVEIREALEEQKLREYAAEMRRKAVEKEEKRLKEEEERIITLDVNNADRQEKLNE